MEKYYVLFTYKKASEYANSDATHRIKK